MNTYISLLRGINVSGQKKIRMDELKALYESLGYERVTTYIQSGNVVFDAQAKPEQSQIEKAIKDRFGFDVPVSLRSAGEFADVLAANPFSKRPGIDETKLHVVFLEQIPGASAVENLRQIQSGEDEWNIHDKEVYLYCPNGYGRTKLTNTILEKKLGVTATTRNWKTANQLYHIARPKLGT